MPHATAQSPQTPQPRCHALLPCAGTGSRAGTATPKQYQPLDGQPLVLHTLAAFAAVERIASCWVVVAPGDDYLSQDGRLAEMRVHLAPCGGNSRAQSVFNGLQTLLAQGVAPTDWVLVHDAARCLVTSAQVNALMDACWHDPVGGLLALQLPDTLKAETHGRVSATVDRSDKWLAQTPQMFRVGALYAALKATQAQDFAGVTDEASAMEISGLRPRLVRGSAQNFKVTYPEDFALAEAILKSRS
ncbi:MAG: 2-C-methyl-D-erythritol 4-phosphate cytidylyltransferase [Hydrogenophaga sp.]|uniref:2-C-methyl-D-erythritol 4-phosphate cytidylyltransferase n=1 Tax=Hydrogenophaga sp. TaxID=1904254 RepID=UPI002ABA6931|nr:2-C-methyl-D-erythritol 4-phosphate cytidylyltransferase [Hydrogenophaga sp.]MDZ4186565.1 2-C-methyl-D-erythritol 4-phosphate cytidylyltransferase [Hydrogenophaga sp.]